MLLGITTEEAVLGNAKSAHQLREKAVQIYTDFLKISNPPLQAFIKSIFPDMTFSN